MLVLSRDEGEKIIITVGDVKVVVCVVGFRGGKARLGFEAPDEVIINREEVFDAIQRRETNGNGSGPSKQNQP